ncbi:MAG TPA: four helix bundle protein [Phycisphaerae bacterium]|nr:four helix bundle protein [Phycisphaerae bacterium]
MASGYSARYEELRVRTFEFARRIVRLFRALPRTEEARTLGKQFLRSGTSVGANYRAVCRSRSRADFIAKLNIVLEEADETKYWLDLLVAESIVPAPKLGKLQEECEELVRIFAASLLTAETNASSKTPK